MSLKHSLTRVTIPQSSAEVISNALRISCHGRAFLFSTIANSLVIANLICFAAYNKALEDAITVLDKIAVDIDVNDRKCLHLLVC